ncbi:MAG: hypothetical protein AAGI48_09365 [Verrucomicrobiota bacterium]
MAPAVPSGEADRFARRAVEVAARQRDEWGMELSPWLHNGMVNIGLKPSGRCYEWAEALYDQLEEDLPTSLRMTMVQSDRGKLREHHAISLHQQRDRWSEGILLDGWKKAGLLVYLPIGESDREWEFEAENPGLRERNPRQAVAKSTGG